MHTIYKYELEVTDEQYIEIPKFAKVLCIQVQNTGIEAVPCIWVEVDSAQILERTRIRMYGTGHPMDEYSRYNRSEPIYLGTFQLEELHLVFHVYNTTGLQ